MSEERKSIQILFESAAPTLRNQLVAQGFEVPKGLEAKFRVLDGYTTQIKNLVNAGLLTNTEARKARQRVVKQLVLLLPRPKEDSRRTS